MKEAFILRMKTLGRDRVPTALECNCILIGWSDAEGLLNRELSWEEFRELVKVKYFPDDEDQRRAGSSGGHLWRFIREMKEGDLVVVPHDDSDFYIAKVIGDATYDPTKKECDTAYRRKVKWLNDKKPIPRTSARSALISRMRAQGTCIEASDLIGDIRICLCNAASGHEPTFQNDLQKALTEKTLEKLQSGYIDSDRFESLIRDVMKGLGAYDAGVVVRNQDKGADVLARFRVAGVFSQLVAIQAKYFKPEPPVNRDAVEQLIRGLEAEGADWGIVITSGKFSNEAEKAAKCYFEEKGTKIELIDGYQFAKLIVEHGVSAN